MEALPINTGVLEWIKKWFETLTQWVMNETPYVNPAFDFYTANKLNPDDAAHIKDKQAKIEVVNRFKWNLDKLMNHRQVTIHAKWIQAIKDYQLTNIDRALELKRRNMLFLTNEKIPIIRSHTDRTIKALFDGKFTWKVYGAQWKDRASNKEYIQHFANWIYSSADIRNVVIEIWTDSLLLGNWFLRTGFDPIPFDKKQIAQLFKSNDDAVKPASVAMTTPLANAEYVSPFNIYAEPYTDFYDQPIYYRYIDSINNVMNNYKNFFTLTESQLAFIMWSPQYFSNKNYNKIKLIKYYEDFIINNSFGYTIDDLYSINPKAAPVEIVEYEYENNFAIIVNWYLCYDWPNPYYYEWRKEKHRYKTLCSNEQWGTWVAQGIGISLAGIQKLYDALFNIMFDLAKFAAGPMFIVEPGQWIEWCETQLNYEPFAIKKSRGLQDAKLTTLELPKPDAVNFTMMNNLLEYANMLIAPTVYNQIQTQSRSATDSEYRKEWLKTQLNDLAESYWQLFDSMLKDYIMYAKKSLGSHEIDILNITGGEEVRKKITAKKLEGNFIYETEFESLRDLNSVIDRSQYIQLMDVISRVGQDPVTGQFLVNMRKFIQKGMELFDQDSGMLLSQPEYMQLIEDMEKEKLKIQWVLQEAQKAIYAENPEYQQWTWEGWEYSPEQQAAYAAKGREMRAGGSQVGGQAPEKLTTANILKQVNE